MKISFDFDDTLTHEEVQKCAVELRKQGHEIYILTARFNDKYDEDGQPIGWGKDWNDDLKELASILEIPRDRWLFAGIGSKSHLAKIHHIELHLDDSRDHVNDVGTVCKSVLFNQYNWQDSLKRFISLVR